MKAILVCPRDPRHRLSADAEPRSYYCYACAEHYTHEQLAELTIGEATP